ncbi:hypothetical protein RND71_035689 [Anisodus tanguticus]|uniref:Peroxidase n=1 Tax=Anisodus tanguticus TaxID=243964 RepID=A0AAE1R643_9SOLA|nr:hypothetical protein RND71_035689 [Anisodus tanguticus]
MGASLLHLHFHDCFVNGCDASILLDQIYTIDSEKIARANNNSARGFEVIDKIKSEVDKVCGHSVVSCADILAVAAHDSVVAVLTWEVKLGRRDSTTASRTTANNDIPTPLMDLPALIDNFKKQGLDEEDLVALSGGHTLGFAQCSTFRNRIYNDNNIDSIFVVEMGNIKPLTGNEGQIRINCRMSVERLIGKGLLTPQTPGRPAALPMSMPFIVAAAAFRQLHAVLRSSVVLAELIKPLMTPQQLPRGVAILQIREAINCGSLNLTAGKCLRMGCNHHHA